VSSTKRIVCLANSRKLQGRCIAGREAEGALPGAWIRPVSAREGEEVSEYERQYEDGSDPRVLDVLDVPLLKPLPKAYQQENWLLDPNGQWRKVGRVKWSELAPRVDPISPLWMDGHSSFNGRNDRIPLAQAQALRSSLRLVHVGELRLSVLAPGEAFGNPKRRVQGMFHHAGVPYRLWVTDPAIERAFLAKADGDYRLGECMLTISLGEPYNDYCYKLIAAVIERRTLQHEER
jgi:hypothetical protein